MIDAVFMGCCVCCPRELGLGYIEVAFDFVGRCVEDCLFVVNGCHVLYSVCCAVIGTGMVAWCGVFVKEKVMAKRRRMSRKSSRKNFRKTAGRTHKKNLRVGPMRGGIRL